MIGVEQKGAMADSLPIPISALLGPRSKTKLPP
jgi:hypothetical protein